MKYLEYVLNNGGITMNKFGEKIDLKSGYICSNKNGIILKLSDDKALAKEQIKSAIKAIKLQGLKRFQYIGVWIDGDMVYIDVNKRYATKREAVAKGVENAQLAIWNNKKQCEIRLD